MIDHATYLAACERLRRLASGDGLLDVYGVYKAVHDMVDYDKITVYDAEHDPAPATVEWLQEVVCKQDEYECGARYFHISMDVGVCVDPDGMVAVAIDYINRFANPTRGDVLRLLRVFNERKV